MSSATFEDMSQSESRKGTVKIVGAVPRSIKDERSVDRAYESARKEIRALRQAASTRKAAKAG